jgi:AraC family transcriptional regulator
MQMDAPLATRPYAGDFVAWSGGALFIGEGGGAVDLHAHYAIQFVLGCPDGLAVRSGRRGEWQRVAGAMVASRTVHAIDVSQCRWSCVLFLEPETLEGRAIGQRLRHGLEALDGDVVASVAARLEHAWRTACDEDSVRDVSLDLIRRFAGTIVAPPPDARVLAAIERISAADADLPSLEALAAAAHLSPSRFRHLFVETTGMPLRSYLLWRRLLKAWERLTDGMSIADAAHEAGFADASHLSRTCRVMFGLAPSTMAMAGPLSRRRQRGARQRV